MTDSPKTVIVFSADPWNSALPVIRLRRPAGWAGWKVIQGNDGPNIWANRISDAEVVIIQRDFPRFSDYPRIIQEARRLSKPVIYEADDWLLEVPDSNLQSLAYQDVLASILSAVIQSDLVITSTEYLRNKFLLFNSNTIVFPNYLDDTLWKIQSPKLDPSQEKPNQVVTIGYMGGRTHQSDLQSITAVLTQLDQLYPSRLRFKFWGCPPPLEWFGRSNVAWKKIDILDYVEFAAFFLSQSCDIVIAPLVDNEFNRAKSAIKFLEYSALGFPGVYSRCEPYAKLIAHGETGFLASTEAEWVASLRLLIDDPALRARIAARCQAELVQHWILRDHAQEWDAAIRQLPNRDEADRARSALLEKITHKTQNRIWCLEDRIRGLGQDLAQAYHDKNQLIERLRALGKEPERPLPPQIENSQEDLSIRYHAVSGTHLDQAAGQPLLCYAEGGRVAVDETIARLWQAADGRTLGQVLQKFEPDKLSRDAVSAALACLCEAGLLARKTANQPPVDPPPHQPAPGSTAQVSVIIVAYNGVAWLKDCLPSILNQTYPSIEIILVDNASTDPDLGAWMKQTYSQVLFYRLEKALSFAAANNYGAGLSHGEYLFLLNQDTRLAPDAIAQLVCTAESNPRCAAVASKLKLWWASAFLNGMGNHVPDRSWGSDLGFGLLDLGQLDHWQEVPSACFAAALIPKHAWDVIGPIDPGFPFYYEDSEWCYRARVLGYNIIPAPRAVVYHAFGGRVPSGEKGGLSPFKLRRASYGRLRFALQVTSGSLTRQFVRNYRAEDTQNFLAYLKRGRIRSAWAIIGAYLDLYRTRPEIERVHQSIQVRSEVSPEAVFRPLAEIPPVLEWNGLPRLTWTDIRDYYLPLMLQGRTRKMPEFENTQRRPNLLIVSNDVVDTKMAGPGIRYLEMAKALSKQLDVTLAVPGQTKLQIPEIRLVTYQENVPASLMVLIDNHDQSLVSGYMVLKFPQLKTTNSRLIVDLYDPFFLENLNYYIHDPIEAQDEHNRLAIKVMNQLAQIGDFFICGNERQRDLWMGLLAANGRINPRTFLQDETLRKLIDVVGVGFPGREPARRPYLRGIHPAFDSDSQIVLWGGGIWNWLDPITLVKAWPKVVAQHPKARLVFLGTRHPNPAVPKHEIVGELIAQAELTGEKERSVFFIEWVPFEEREALLTEANIGVTLHPIHVETRYSIRTRVLDYFWARLPTLITQGDVTSEWVEEFRVGRTVPARDEDATAAALNEMLDQPKEFWQPGFDRIRSQFTWEKIAQPLVEFCYRGSSASDRSTIQAQEVQQNSYADVYQNIGSPIKKAAFLWATKGLKSMIRQTIFHVRFLLSRH